jgi:hypothetical protein
MENGLKRLALAALDLGSVLLTAPTFALPAGGPAPDVAISDVQ